MEKIKTEKQKQEEKETKLFSRYASGMIKGVISVPKPLKELVDYNKLLKGVEEHIEKQVHGIIGQYDIYTKYLQHIQGIGPMFAANLISMIDPPERFPRPSSLTAFAGLTGRHYEAECARKHKIIYAAVPKTGKCNVMVTTDEGESFGDKREPCGANITKIEEFNTAPRRKAGYVLMINSTLKTTMFKIANSFEKQPTEKSFYRKLYVEWKAEALAKYPEDEKGHVLHARLTAIRKVSSRFLIDLHVNWMNGLGFEVTPYQETLQGHTIFPLKLDDKTVLPPKGSIAPIQDDQRYSMKQIVGSYYDVQKLRIASFNNIVSWCKSHRDVLPSLPETRHGKDDEADVDLVDTQ